MKDYARSKNMMAAVANQKETYFRELSDEQVRHDAANNGIPITRRKLVR